MAWQRVAPLADLPEGRGVRVDIPGHRVALFKVDGAVHALGDRCSHAEASLAEGSIWGASVECPRHGAEFDLATGAAQSLPASKPVPVYETRIEDGIVLLALPEESP